MIAICYYGVPHGILKLFAYEISSVYVSRGIVPEYWKKLS